MSCIPEPTMQSCDTGQRIPFFDSCQLITTWMSNTKIYTDSIKVCHLASANIKGVDVRTNVLHIVQLLSTKIVHFYDKSMKLCQITTNPKTNIFGYGAKPNSTLDTSTVQALKWPA